jgi:uncharacterized protein (TIGR02145 family)
MKNYFLLFPITVMAGSFVLGSCTPSATPVPPTATLRPSNTPLLPTVSPMPPSPTMGPAVTDIDGNVYNTVIIGAQTWMKENLKTTKYRNGDAIGTTNPATLDISSEAMPKFQWAYDGNESNATVYGRLYTWYAVTDSRNVCPTGWHVPTVVEWRNLINFLGGEVAAHGILKEAGVAHWKSPNTDATDERGFTALPGGSHWPTGEFVDMGMYVHYWTATEANATEANRVLLNYKYLGANTVFSSADKKIGWSERCVKG